MKEEFLQYIWQSSLYRKEDLRTFDGQPIQVIRPGQLNRDAGPDFFNSKLMIGDTTWAGNVEVHLNSSEWMQHGHQFDAAYNNVVLHVVYEHDEDIVNQMGKSIPTLELRSLIPSSVISRYHSLSIGKNWVACEHLLPDLEQEKVIPFIHRLLIERLEDKVRYIQQDLILNKNNWEQTFYEYLARNFGFKTNALPFHVMAKNLPLQILAKHKQNLLQLEAILFGQAGLLNQSFEEEYPERLRKEYGYLRKAYQLEPVNESLWKFATMRPANFPTIRIAQFAQLIHHSSSLFSRCMEIRSIKELRNLFNVSLQDYWESHYNFDQSSVPKEKKLGHSSIDNIFINTIAPFMFAYGKEKLNEILAQRSIEMMEKLAPEVNGTIKNWGKLGFQIGNAFQSQAFIQLKNMYCTPKKCLSCGIGNQLLKT